MIDFLIDLNLFLATIVTIVLPATMMMFYVNICKNDIPSGLDRRMKYYERMSEKIVDISPNTPFLINLDLRTYSKFASSNDDQSYSREYRNAMIHTAMLLRKEYSAHTVYVHLGGFVLIFGKRQRHIFEGKVTKILSAVSSHASAIFAMIDEKCTLKDVPSFSSKIVVFPSEHEIVNYMICKSNSSVNNFVTIHANNILGTKEIHGMSMDKRIEQLNKHGLNLTKIDDLPMKYGMFIKKYLDTPICLVFENFQYSESMLDLLMNPSYDENYDDMADVVYHKSTEKNIRDLLNISPPKKN